MSQNLQLSPAESFPIVRVLPDNQDANTYYVRAYVYDEDNNTLLETINLTEVSTRRFRYVWKVPWNNAYGHGKHLTIITRVFTDSGYTTASANYYDEVSTYIVQQRWTPNHSGGYVDVDYKKIAEIVGEKKLGGEKEDRTEEIIEAIKGIKFPEQKPVVPYIHIPEQPAPVVNVDMSGVEKGLERVLKAIEKLPKEKPDFTPVLAEIQKLPASIQKHIQQEYGKRHTEMTNAYKEDTPKLVELTAESVAERVMEIINKKESEIKEEKRNSYLNKLKLKHGIL